MSSFVEVPATIYFNSSNAFIAIVLDSNPKKKFTVTDLKCWRFPHETSTATDLERVPHETSTAIDLNHHPGETSTAIDLNRHPGETSTSGDDKKYSARTLMFKSSASAPSKVEEFFMMSQHGNTNIYLGSYTWGRSSLVVMMEGFETGRHRERGQGTWSQLEA
ncbi:hypothetical protein FRC08_018854 [Ceratobasidium sp. 394]|nr:hypothetical protein FRC08_018854 [Ceratobasidium sp. 394]